MISHGNVVRLIWKFITTSRCNDHPSCKPSSDKVKGFWLWDSLAVVLAGNKVKHTFDFVCQKCCTTRHYHYFIFSAYFSQPHCVKSVHIRSCSGPYFPAFGLNTGKYGLEQLRIRTPLTQCQLPRLDPSVCI